MITMEMPHIQLISEAISQLIFTNDPPKESLELPLQHRHMFVMPRCLKVVKTVKTVIKIAKIGILAIFL